MLLISNLLRVAVRDEGLSSGSRGLIETCINLADTKGTSNLMSRAAELQKKGMSLRQISKELGISHETVRKYITFSICSSNEK